MVSSQCMSGQQPVVTRSPDGKLWFATTRGLCVIDPAQIRRTSQPPPVVLEEVVVDEQTAWKRPFNSFRSPPAVIKLPPDNATLSFHFTALSLTVPQRNRFRFQLEGLNRDWVDANTERTVYYTRVPPGDYKFKVIACNHEGLWNQTGVTLAVTVLPYWWQTTWFRSLMVAGAGLLLLAAYRWRMRNIAREQVVQRKFSRQLIESQERERQRISAELHDSLGQSLLVVKNYAVMALKDSTPPDRMREKVREISEATTASIEEVRSIARALRPYQLDRFGLTKTLEDAAELLAKSGSLRMEINIDNVDHTFSPDAEISIYRVVQEWLNNVTKHSTATVAGLFVRREAGWVHLIMEDNGIGFDYAAVKARPAAQAGVGLDNLNERVRLLEGTLRIETAPGQGTRLCVDIPCKK
jgi:signal transduction histidine kinase